MFLSVSIRVQWLCRITRGFTNHPLYISVYVIGITVIFWAVVAAVGDANVSGMKHLAESGWLFTIEDSIRNQSGLGTLWNYWSLFNFHLVQWSAMTAAAQDIVLLVVIGVLTLPIYVPALALALDEPVYDMNHELLGNSASNLLAGMVGTIPNLLVSLN